MLAQRLDIPLMGDEICLTPADVMREIELDALRVVSLKTARTGFTLSWEIVHLCEQAGIRNLHGMRGDSSTGCITSAHFCADFKNTSHYYPSESSFYLMLVDDFLKEPVIIYHKRRLAGAFRQTGIGYRCRREDVWHVCAQIGKGSDTLPETVQRMADEDRRATGGGR